METLAGRKRISVRTKAGFRFGVDRTDYIQRTVFNTGGWEAEIENTLRAELKPQDVFFDIGANAGYFSLLALKLGCHKVVAFEPNPELQCLFLHNMHLNKFPAVRWNLVCSALGDAPGEMAYQEGPAANSGVGRLVANNVPGTATVKVVTLDELLDSGSVPWPTLLKLDVEGWELRVLRGAQKLFETMPPKLLVFEADSNPDGCMLDQDMLHFFQDRNYTVSHLPRLVMETKENYIARLVTKSS